MEYVLIPGGQEVYVRAVPRDIAIREDKWLSSLALIPSVLEGGRVPVYLHQHIRDMDPPFRAIIFRTLDTGEGYIGLVVIESFARVIVVGHMDICS